MFLSHFGPDQSCAPAGIVQTIGLNKEHLTICTRVLAHIALVYPEPTLFFFELFVLFTMEPYGFEAAKHDKLGTYGGRVAYLIKRPRFCWLYIATPPLLASLLLLSGLLTKFSKNYFNIHLFYIFVNEFLK